MCFRFGLLVNYKNISKSFNFQQERCVKLTVEQAIAFQCRVQSACVNKTDVDILSSGPIIVLCLGREDSVEKWKELMGPENCSVARQSAPTSLRALYGDLRYDSKNAVYGCMNDSTVEHELQFFFPNCKSRQPKDIFHAQAVTISFLYSRLVILEPICGFDKVNEYLCSVIYQPLTDAVFEMTKVKPDDPLEWLASFMLKHNKNKPVVNEGNPDTRQRLIEVERVDQKNDSSDERAKQPCGCSVVTTPSDSFLVNN